jgi:hypothetical protein
MTEETVELALAEIDFALIQANINSLDQEAFYAEVTWHHRDGTELSIAVLSGFMLAKIHEHHLSPQIQYARPSLGCFGDLITAEENGVPFLPPGEADHLVDEIRLLETKQLVTIRTV